MTIKKLTLLAVTALSLSAFALPVTASAAEFTHRGNPVPEVGESEIYVGTLTLEAPDGTGGRTGWNCEQVRAEVMFQPESASIDSWQAEGCESFGYINTIGCHVEKMEFGYMPWQLSIDAPDQLQSSEWEFDIYEQAGCGLPGFGNGGVNGWAADPTVSPGNGGPSLEVLKVHDPEARNWMFGRADLNAELQATWEGEGEGEFELH